MIEIDQKQRQNLLNEKLLLNIKRVTYASQTYQNKFFKKMVTCLKRDSSKVK